LPGSRMSKRSCSRMMSRHRGTAAAGLLEGQVVGRQTRRRSQNLSCPWFRCRHSSRLGALISAQSAPVVVMTHSMSGPYGWKLLEESGKNIAAVLAIAPGPPSNIQKPVQILSETPEKVEVQMAARLSISLKDPLVANQDLIEKKLIGPNSTQFPRSAKAAYEATLVTIPPRLIYERVNIGNSQLKISDFSNYGGKRIAVVIGTDDPDHPIEMDKPIVDWLNQNGAKAELITLGDRGIKGNGHMMMIEVNSDQIAGLLIEWLEKA
jgi:pimeloyl-ACP methyl ester carboxylesterase